MCFMSLSRTFHLCPVDKEVEPELLEKNTIDLPQVEHVFSNVFRARLEPIATRDLMLPTRPRRLVCFDRSAPRFVHISTDFRALD